MTVEIAMRLSGFLFLFVLVTLAASIPFGNKIGNSDSDSMLQKINRHPKIFQLNIVLALIEYIRVIALAIMLFIAFSLYNIILGIVWATCRTGEGLILIYNEIKC
ncbi:MAG: hypothetical protein WBB69_08345 [Anaerolineales bacterium]